MNHLKKCNAIVLMLFAILVFTNAAASAPGNLIADDFSTYDNTNSITEPTLFTEAEGQSVAEYSANDFSWKNSEINKGVSILSAVSEDFSSYAGSTAWEPKNKVYFSDVQTGAKDPVIAANDFYSWKLSSKLVSNSPDLAYAYLNTGGFFLRGSNNAWPAVVNMDIGDKKLSNITRVSADISPNGTPGARPAITFLMNEDENRFYVFGIGCGDGSYGWEGDTGPIKHATPFVARYTDFVTGKTGIADDTVCETANSDITSHTNGIMIPKNYTVDFNQNWSHIHWDIETDIQTNTVSWTATVTPRANPSSKLIWSDKIIDPELSNMIANSKYPIGMYAVRNESIFENIDVSMDFEGEESKQSVDGISYVDISQNRLGVGGSTDNIASVNLISDADTTADVQKFEFTTELNDKFIGLSTFVNSTEDCYYLFGQRNNTSFAPFLAEDDYSFCPIIIEVNNNIRTIKASDTVKSGWNKNDTKLNWTVTFDNGTVYYNVKSSKGNEFSGKFTCDRDIISDYEYLMAISGMGSRKAGGFASNIKYTAGSYYNGGMGEPEKALYVDLAENCTPDDNNVIKIDNYADFPIRRVVAFGLTDKNFYLSEDGISYDSFTFDKTYEWLNTENAKAYKYIKFSEKPTDSILVLARADGQTISLEKKKSLYVYPSLSGIIPTFNFDYSDFSVDDNKYASVDRLGKMTGIAGGTVTLSYNAPDGDVLKTSVKVISALTKALESDDPDAMRGYIAGQRTLINKLNTAIDQKNQNDVRNFIKITITDIDAVTSPEILNISGTELDGLANRLLNYTDDFKCESLDDIYELEKIMLKEIHTGYFINVNESGKMTELIKKYSEEFGFDIKTDYYKNQSDAITDALLNNEFKNYTELINTYGNNLVMLNFHSSISPSYLKKLIEDMQQFIRYDAEHYSDIKDKTDMVKELISDKSSINTVEELRYMIDSYKNPSDKNKNSGGGGGGGGSLSSGGFSVQTSLDSMSQINIPNDDGTIVDRNKIFNDVEIDFWAYEPIRFLVAKEIASGYEDNTYRPYNNISRAEFTKIVLNAFGTPVKQTDDDYVSVFGDVTHDKWYFDYVNTAAEEGIVTGYGDLFVPEGLITREEMAVIVMRAIIKCGKTLNRNTEIVRFSDEDSISEWARPSVLKLAAAGVINGFGSEYAPQNNASRAEIAQIIYKAFSACEEGVSDES